MLDFKLVMTIYREYNLKIFMELCLHHFIYEKEWTLLAKFDQKCSICHFWMTRPYNITIFMNRQLFIRNHGSPKKRAKAKIVSSAIFSGIVLAITPSLGWNFNQDLVTGLDPNFNTTIPNLGLNLRNCCRNIRARDILLSFAAPSVCVGIAQIGNVWVVMPGN